MPTNQKAPRMSDEAVKAKTGKIWKQWFAVLDKDGAQKMTHQEIAQYLSEKHSVPPWWSQMVTATYEQQSGRRQNHERPDGFQISISRTVNVPLAKLYKSFAADNARSTWLPENNLQVRKATPNKSMRVTWSDQKTSLEINFYAKATDKSQVVVQHSKLANASAATKMKSYWTKALDRLRENLEG
ncbi:MAG TPA: SRPBCC domain-containing protein [Pyrinomonadaceae bacterium]|nr:SRPBCC domain-containing protein [Pyrinomonadaceae bacterium]